LPGAKRRLRGAGRIGRSHGQFALRAKYIDLPRKERRKKRV